jgi:hypothetical protein
MSPSKLYVPLGIIWGKAEGRYPRQAEIFDPGKTFGRLAARLLYFTQGQPPR